MAANSRDQYAAPVPPGRGTVEDEVVAAEQALAEAIVANDAARIAGCVTNDWVIVSEGGVSDGKSLLDLIASGQVTHSAMQVVGQPQVRVLSPTTTVLTARITNTAHHQGRRFDADEWTTDVYVKHDGRWLCALTHYTAVART